MDDAPPARAHPGGLPDRQGSQSGLGRVLIKGPYRTLDKAVSALPPKSALAEDEGTSAQGQIPTHAPQQSVICLPLD
ncbi:hypothetical protein Q2941_37430, partial [Bradyrhizobium sp. UFLA05-153]